MSRGLILALVLAAAGAPGVGAQGTAYNPEPMEGDLVLPMPGGAEMVFRKVGVPGAAFWGDPERVVQVGDAQGGIFEGLQRAQVSGSFPDPEGPGWAYYLGKYEVTLAQFVAVMGMEALQEASGDRRTLLELQRLEGERLERALMKPLTFVGWDSLRTFVHRYNLWLLDPEHPERMAALPRIAGVPGFVRLPTELEWEYAARGGSAAVEAGTFTDPLPFEPGALAEHAWHYENAKHKLRPIGLRNPNGLGLFDMLGNAQELTSGRFHPELWQGKPGGLTARGGSVGTQAARMRSSRREEVEVYRWNEDSQRMEEARSYNSGLRLAIGSNVVLSPGNRSELESAYLAYRQQIRARMPVGMTLDNPVAQAATQLGDAREILAGLIERNPGLAAPLEGIAGYIDEAEESLDRAQRKAARAAARDALRNATDLGRDVFKLALQREQLEKTRRLAELSTRYQDLVDQIEADIRLREDYADQLLERYGDSLAELGEQGAAYTREALAGLGEVRLTRRAEAALELLARHVDGYREARRPQPQLWRRDFDERFKDLADQGAAAPGR